MALECNVGGSDKIARIVVGVVLVAAAAFAPMTAGWRIAALVVAGIAIITALTGFCLLNKLLGVNTCQTNTRNRHA